MMIAQVDRRELRLGPGREARPNLAVFWVVFGTVLGVAQSAPQYGHRIGGGVAFLTESSEIKEPDNPRFGDFVPSVESLRLMMENNLRARLELLANSTGADQLPLVSNADGSKRLVFAQNPVPHSTPGPNIDRPITSKAFKQALLESSGQKERYSCGASYATTSGRFT